MKNDNYKTYSVTLGEPLKEYMEWAIDRFHETKNTESETFNRGYMMAFHKVVTLMKKHAENWEIDLKELGIEIEESVLPGLAGKSGGTSDNV